MTETLTTGARDSGEEAAPPSHPGKRIEGRTPLQLAVARLRKDKVSLIAAGFIVFLVLVAVFAPVVAPHDPNQQFRETGLSPAGIPVSPNGEYWLGTDRLGRDLFSRIVYGSR